MRSKEGDSWTRWVHEIRKAEFEGMTEAIPLGRDSTVLEFGCGDGFQLNMLRERYDKVFAIDPGHIPIDSTGCTYAFAEALPFPDRTFDLIVSNCVLEHLSDRSLGINEAVRVLKPGGYMAHVVPARYWKVASLVLNPIGYPLRVAEKLWAARKSGTAAKSNVRDESPRPSMGTVLSRLFYPPIHGTFDSHLAELREYGRRSWLAAFEHPGLILVTDFPLLCSTQFGFLRFCFLKARWWLGRRGLDSSRVFVLQKQDG
jgi:SAM-dependent methyltransferase